MDRDAFIRECVRALEGLAVGNSCREDAGTAEEAVSALYDHLTYDFPDLGAGDLARLLEWVCAALRDGRDGRDGRDRASLGAGWDRDESIHPVFALVLGAGVGHARGAWDAREASHGATRDPAAALATVLDTLKEKAQSTSQAEDVTLWQQLYGLHVFGLLAHGEEGLVEGLAEGLVEGGISYHGLSNESTWASGTFVSAARDVLYDVVHGRSGGEEMTRKSGARRREAACGLLEALVLGARSPAIATAVFGLLMDICGSEGPSSVGVRVARARVARMVAAACLADGRIVRLDTARRALFELVEPVLGRSTGERGCEEAEEEAEVQAARCSMVRLAGGVLLEHVVQEQLRCAGFKSVQQRFEEEMIRRGLWGVLVSSMASSSGLAQEGDRGAAARISVARALVMTSAYSAKLHAWAMRVPGYAAAWAPRDGDKTSDYDDVNVLVLRAAWSALRACADEETPRHVRFLREVFCGRGVEEVAELTNFPSTLEMTERLCRALEVRDGSNYAGDLDTVDRIEGLRAVVRERILAAERGRVVDEDRPRRLSTLPEVERLRYVDRMLKGLCGASGASGASGVRGTTSTNGKCD